MQLYLGLVVLVAFHATMSVAYESRLSHELLTPKSIANFDITNHRDELIHALEHNRALVNLTDSSGCTPLIVSAMYGHYHHVYYQLEHQLGFAPNMTSATCMEGKTSLHFGAICSAAETLNHALCPDHLRFKEDGGDSHVKVIEVLAKYGADLNAQDQHGRTPAHYAALNAHGDALEVLLDFGADLAVKDSYGWTPMFYAVQQGDLPTMQLLLRQDRALQQVDWSQATPLMHASKIGHREVVRLLLQAGVSPLKVDQHGKRAIDYAKEGNHMEIVNMLRIGAHTDL